MAYTNLFKVFADSSTNLRTDTDWSSNAERSSGFVSGAVANSTNVNTAIKSNSLVSVALMDLVAAYSLGSGNLGLTSTTDTLKNALLSMFQSNFNLSVTTDEKEGDSISLSMFSGTSKSVKIENVKNLTSKPVFANGSSTTIKLTVGGQTSDNFTVPYANKANSANTANSLGNLASTSSILTSSYVVMNELSAGTTWLFQFNTSTSFTDVSNICFGVIHLTQTTRDENSDFSVLSIEGNSNTYYKLIVSYASYHVSVKKLVGSTWTNATGTVYAYKIA